MTIEQMARLIAESAIKRANGEGGDVATVITARAVVGLLHSLEVELYQGLNDFPGMEAVFLAVEDHIADRRHPHNVYKYE